MNERLICYSLYHANNPRLNTTGRIITTRCPIEWWKNRGWDDTLAGGEKGRYRWSITCVVEAASTPEQPEPESLDALVKTITTDPTVDSFRLERMRSQQWYAYIGGHWEYAETPHEALKLAYKKSTESED